MNFVAPAAFVASLALILRRGGCSDDIANEVAASLVDADLAGHGSHGARQIDFYVDRLLRGEVDGRARAVVEFDGRAVIRIDGRRAFGQVVGAWAARLGADRARQFGVSLVCIDGAGHLGRNGRWPEIAAAAGVGSLHFGAGLPGPGQVAPFGGSLGRLNTNPIAFGLPGTGDDDALIFDGATSAISASALKQLFDRGERLDESLLIRDDGSLSDDPADFVNGLAAVPTFGGFKGYSLSVLAEVLSSIVAPAQPPAPATNSLFSLYFDVERLIPRERYRAELRAWRDRLHGAEGEATSGVVFPGDRSRVARREAAGRGISLTADIVSHVRRAANAVKAWDDVVALSPAFAIAGDESQRASSTTIADEARA